MRILIANRGEIAVRIIRTADRLGLETVAAYADPDRSAPFAALATIATRLGPADLALSYLSIEAIVDAASRTNATAVHPGYGFLAERADFARAVQSAGLVWIGPRPEAIEAMGSKIEARRIAEAASVPLIAGFDGSQADDALVDAAQRIGYPVMIKASAGGGGKGIRIVLAPQQFAESLAQVRAEAQRSFGDAAVIVERYVQRPRHIEVQLIGDHHGNIVDLGTRECSVQRRHQKVLEEAPAPNLTTETRGLLRSSAADLAKAIAYDSLGTVEYLVDDETGQPYFLEMNTRLQVEHPVTEEVTGLDLVELQIRVAMGERLSFPIDGPAMSGHAFEARINAEDPFRGFIPQTGTVTSLTVPPGARWDSGIALGSVITPHYDPLLAKLIVTGNDRESARRALIGALDQLLIGGIVSNTGLHRWLLEQDPLMEGRITTRYLDDNPPQPLLDLDAVRALAALAWLSTRDASTASKDTWRRLGRFRVTPHSSPRPVLLADLDGEVAEVAVEGSRGTYRLADGRLFVDVAVDNGHLRWSEGDVGRHAPVSVDLERRLVAVAVDGLTTSFVVRSRVDAWSGAGVDGSRVTGAPNDLRSPFPASVSEVRVAEGDEVEDGQVLLVLEAMKMLHSLKANGAGTVREVLVKPGSQVASGDVLITFFDAGALTTDTHTTDAS